ncbi:acetylornithine deacetylase [Marinimicrobium alkaliphilum]|uniref:acetylornithine deacetylase n=1 Tax=Marinimicrobium alkaliphilum TaxID=2202654 RepID=UPI000DB9839A|nr:acetylornithine deacetylase [Marinimicrobium alkaliphilum]
MTFDAKRYREQLQALVAQPSVSCAVPDWDMSNLGVIELLAQWLEDLGFRTQVIPLAQKGKANLIATLGQGDGGLVLSGHSDTVPYDAGRWQSDPFKLTEKDGKLYGLGATDMKGFFPVVLEAVRAFTDAPLKQPIIVLATADEESSMSGARALVDASALKARYAVIGEPTGLRPVHMHKGIMMESLRVRGQSGHSSNPALGKNALEVMHTAMGELMALRSEWQEKYRNPAFAVQVPTMNLGCIHGGDGANRICGECELHFDLRALPGMDNAELHAAIDARLRPLAERSGTDIVLSELFESVAPFGESADSELVKACEALTGQSAEAVAFATEAPFMQSLGMQTVVMGPGSIDQAHQPDEFIDTRQLEPAVEVIQGLIRRFCL